MLFDHIDDGDFEEIAYDLLVALGFKNVIWRRGSGKGGATADQGRDIVAEELRTGIDGSIHVERWFIQCKHYKAGVPPQKLEDALAWANAERPDVLLFVASNFLSNPAKSFLDLYKSNNRPPFKIRIWERKDLERLLSSRPGIVRKFGLAPNDPFVDAHPAHVHYIMVPTYNTLDYFFEQIERLPRPKIDKIFSWAYHSVINPRFRKPAHKDESLADTMLDVVDYAHFKTKCYKLGESIAENFLVRSIVIEALTWVWHCSNPQLVPGSVSFMESAIEFFSKELAETEDPDDSKSLNGCIAMAQEMMNSSDSRQLSNHGLYTEFCESALLALSLEPLGIQSPDDV